MARPPAGAVPAQQIFRSFLMQSRQPFKLHTDGSLRVKACTVACRDRRAAVLRTVAGVGRGSRRRALERLRAGNLHLAMEGRVPSRLYESERRSEEHTSELQSRFG